MQKKHQTSRQRSQKQRAIDLYGILPEPIHALGLKLFGSDEVLATIVENSVVVDLMYAGVQMTVRMNQADDATTRMGDEAKWMAYDMDTMGDLRQKATQANPQEMLNMLDIGGNYGVVTIAAFKKYPESLRVITVEPITTTFFFLKWNLYLNGIPEIDQDTLDSHLAPGVMALNRGSAANEGQDLHLCFNPSSSMNARVCECSDGEPNCVVVPGITMDSLAGKFGKEPIAMVKMDCEGCEFISLPMLAKPEVSGRIKRLAGELHYPDSMLEELACRWEKGRLMSKCEQSNNPAFPTACGVQLKCM
jgi:FkbM family methyltransferase